MYQRLTLVLQLGPDGTLSEAGVCSAIGIVVRYADLYIAPQRFIGLLSDIKDHTIVSVFDNVENQLRLPLPLQKGAYLNEATVGEALGFIVDNASPNLTLDAISDIISAMVDTRRIRYFAVNEERGKA